LDLFSRFKILKNSAWIYFRDLKEFQGKKPKMQVTITHKTDLFSRFTALKNFALINFREAMIFHFTFQRQKFAKLQNLISQKLIRLKYIL